MAVVKFSLSEVNFFGSSISIDVEILPNYSSQLPGETQIVPVVARGTVRRLVIRSVHVNLLLKCATLLDYVITDSRHQSCD